MRRFLGGVLAVALVAGLGLPARAEGDNEVKAVLDKAVKALGGEEKLAAVKATETKGKGTISIGGNESKMTMHSVVQGTDHVRMRFEATFGDMPIKGVVVLAGDKGWRMFNDQNMEMDKDAIANEKRGLLLQVAPFTILPLRAKGFKLEKAGEDKVNGKAAVGIKVTPPEGKDFTIYFDKDSGLPVRTVAKVAGFMGDEVTQETTYTDFKDVAGIKRPMKNQVKRDGEKFIDSELIEFKVLDKVDPKTFDEPK